MSSKPQGLRTADQDGVPLRMPKLTYRNAIPDPEPVAQFANTTSSDHDNKQGDLRAPPLSQVVRRTSATEDIRPITLHNASARPTYNGPRRSSASAAVGSEGVLAKSDDVKRKKHSSLFGFLSLKEPSTSALEDFARQQQKQAAAKGGRATAVGMPGTSTQKLPQSVPKVNSRWDGLPSPVRDNQKSSRSGKRDSSFTVTSRASISSSSTSSKSSSQASLSSGCSVRFPPLVPSISEIPEEPNQQPMPSVATRSHTTAEEDGQISSARHPISDSTETSSDTATPYQSYTSAGRHNEELHSESVPKHVGGQRAELLPYRPGARATVHSAAQPTSQQLEPSVRSHAVNRFADQRASTPSASLSQDTSANPAAAGRQTSQYETIKESSTPISPSAREQTQSGRAGVDVLPWEAQSPSLQPHAIPQKDETLRKDDEKKRKLGFLSRKHK